MSYQIILFRDERDNVADVLTSCDGYRIFADNVRLSTFEDRDKLVAALKALEFNPRYAKPGEHTVFTKLSELEPRERYHIGAQVIVNSAIWTDGKPVRWKPAPPDATILDLLNKAAGK